MRINKILLVLAIALASFGAAAEKQIAAIPDETGIGYHFMEGYGMSVEYSGDVDMENGVGLLVRCSGSIEIFANAHSVNEVTVNGEPGMPTFVIANNLDQIQTLSIAGIELDINKFREHRDYFETCFDSERSTWLDQNQKEH